MIWIRARDLAWMAEVCAVRGQGHGFLPLWGHPPPPTQ